MSVARRKANANGVALAGKASGQGATQRRRADSQTRDVGCGCASPQGRMILASHPHLPQPRPSWGLASHAPPHHHLHPLTLTDLAPHRQPDLQQPPRQTIVKLVPKQQSAVLLRIKQEALGEEALREIWRESSRSSREAVGRVLRRSAEVRPQMRRLGG